jgi:acetylornithine deacetylase/succinyl-diaminopimelate desuccinylase-like protein
VLGTGQSSDNAHLPNERISMRNLIHGKEVIKEFLVNFAATATTTTTA